ncbi:MAG: serine hydrolase [Hyphomonadaceae bacterium]|nr:serine hydrolase [Hyphomonadaceae bacterium]
MRILFNRRTLLGGLAAAFASPAAAQTFNFSAAAEYSAARRGVSLLVMQDGQILFEDYPRAGGADRGWELASGTKSFSSIIVAAAVQDQLMTLDDPVADKIEEWRNDERKSRITIRQLLSLTSGLRGGTIGRPESYLDSLNTPADYEPGTHFAYGPAPFQIFGEFMYRKLSDDPVAYLQRRVLDALQIAPTVWRRGQDGMPLMPQGAAFTARDWAIFGQFVLEGGRGIIDAETLRQCFVPSAVNPGYGISWWLLRSGLIPPGRGAGVEVPEGAAARLGEVHMAAGAGDQRLYIIPDRNLIVARQADDILRAMLGQGGERWSDVDFLRLLLGA